MIPEPHEGARQDAPPGHTPEAPVRSVRRLRADVKEQHVLDARVVLRPAVLTRLNR
jgi:hypothetical protein